MAVYFADDFSSATDRSRRVARGEIRVIARGVWADEHAATPEDVVQRNWKTIVGRLLPGAVITGRTAFDLRPIDGQLFVSHPRRANLELPGLTVYPDASTDHRRPDDVPLDSSGRLYGASRTRALIDNAETRGRPSSVARRLSRAELHDRIVAIVNSSTARQVENILAQVDADANKVAAADIHVFVDAARGKINTLNTTSTAMQAAQRGEPYDRQRVALLRKVAADLQRQHLIQRFVSDTARAAYVPFYEAYFSNCIEGSTLTIDEAEQVVFEDAEVGDPNDAHDIRATYEIVDDRSEMTRPLGSADDFLDLLRDRHRVMMAAHPAKRPGDWKNKRNQAGATIFVDPEQVPGTLRAGWEAGQDISDPFQRAVYMMFLVSEVHPFADGNGRSARVVMNAELVPHDMHRIIIPTVLRIDYLSGLTRATANGDISGLYRVLDFAQQWVSVGEFGSLRDGDRYLRATNALWDSGVAERQGIRLRQLRLGELWELPDAAFPASAALEASVPSLAEVAADAAD